MDESTKKILSRLSKDMNYTGKQFNQILKLLEVLKALKLKVSDRRVLYVLGYFDGYNEGIKEIISRIKESKEEKKESGSQAVSKQ